MNSKSVKNVLKTVLSLALGAVIVWALYRETNIKELWEIVKSANFGIIAFSLLFGLLGNILRGLRWELLINSLDYYPKRASLVYATLGNYAVNFLLPRAGDFWRCGVVSKYDKIPFAKTFETFLVEKVIDILSVVVIVFLSLILYVDFFISYFRENPGYADNLMSILTSVWMYMALGIIVLVIVLGLTVFREISVMKKIRGFFLTVKQDIKLITGMKEKKRIIMYTIVLWLAFYLYFYICFYAFDFTRGLGFLAGWIVFAMCNVGIAVPVQGGIGAWHFMVISSLVILGVSYNEASAFAGAVFMIQSVWIILCGVFGILALPYVKRDISAAEGRPISFSRTSRK